MVVPRVLARPELLIRQGLLTDTLQWTPYRSIRDLNNSVCGTYIAPNYPFNVAGNLYDKNGWNAGSLQNNFSFAYTPTSYPAYASDVLHGYAADEYLLADGRPLPTDLSFNTVLSVAQAQRCAKINSMRNRQQGSGTFEMSMAAYQCSRVMSSTSPSRRWAGLPKYLRSSGSTFGLIISRPTRVIVFRLCAALCLLWRAILVSMSGALAKS